MTAPCDILRTAKVDIDGIYLIFKHFGSANHDFRVISTNLSHYWSVLGTGGEVDLLVYLLSGHHLGVKHRRVGKVYPVATS